MTDTESEVLRRFKAAAKLAKPDQVPVVLFATGHFFSWHAGINERSYWVDPKKKIEAQLKLQQRFPETLLYPGIYPDYGVAIEPSSRGCEIAFPMNASPQVRKHIDIETFARMEPANPSKDGLMPTFLETYKCMQDMIPNELIERFGYLDGWALGFGPTDVVGLSVGFEDFLSAFYMKPEVVHKAMHVATESVIQFIKAQEKVGGRIKRLIIGDDSIGFLSPQHFSEFSLPCLKKIFDTFNHGLRIFHCDANTTHLLDHITEIGMDVFNFGPAEDIQVVKKRIGNKVCLLGNLNPLGCLRTGTPREVETECRSLIDKGSPGGGYILTTGSALGRDTPYVNIKAMVDAGQKYGRYILGSRLSEPEHKE